MSDNVLRGVPAGVDNGSVVREPHHGLGPLGITHAPLPAGGALLPLTIVDDHGNSDFVQTRYAQPVYDGGGLINSLGATVFATKNAFLVTTRNSLGNYTITFANSVPVLPGPVIPRIVTISPVTNGCQSSIQGVTANSVNYTILNNAGALVDANHYVRFLEVIDP